MQSLTDISSSKEALKKAALEAYLHEYKELTETWRGLEGKAQGSITVAGIFIAASFAYVREISTMRPYEKWLLGIAIALLVISVIFSIIVLKLRKVPPPPLGGFVSYYVRSLIEVNKNEDFQEATQIFFNKHTTKWQSVIEQMYKTNETKAKYLWLAQLILMIAIVIVACLSLFMILI
jgi:hypothetical protein